MVLGVNQMTTLYRASDRLTPQTVEPRASANLPLPPLAKAYPELRYMGSKKRLLPWIYTVLDGLDFETAWDPFSGTGCVAYLMKAMGRRVFASDFLNFTSVVAKATIENNTTTLSEQTVERLIGQSARHANFIETKFSGIFYSIDDLRFLDRVCHNIETCDGTYEQAIALSALFRSCLKRQPRGVFTVSGDLSRYDDGRRDLRLSLEEHFREQVEAFNAAVFDNGQKNDAQRLDIFAARVPDVDLVYLDPPYVPRSDDNCYIKRYHFLEGLSCYWRGLEIDENTKVKKLRKRYTPFSYRRSAVDAFDKMFERVSRSTLVLSYSSNGYPDLNDLVSLMGRYKSSVEVFEQPHRYHFGTHSGVSRANVTEYLIVGR